MQLRTATKFTGELVKRRLKIIFAEENAWQSQCVEFAAERFGVNKRCAEDFEWTRCAAAFRNICPFEKTHAWIKGRGIERRHVG